jgi:hypothetical protein
MSKRQEYKNVLHLCAYWGFHCDVLTIAFLWDVTPRQWMIGFGRFECTQCPDLQGFWGPTEPWRWGHCVPSKRRLPITQWRGFISQKNRVVSSSSKSASLFFTKFSPFARKRAQTLQALMTRSNYVNKTGLKTKFMQNVQPLYLVLPQGIIVDI